MNPNAPVFVPGGAAAWGAAGGGCLSQAPPSGAAPYGTAEPVPVIATVEGLHQALVELSREPVLYIDCEGADLSKGSWRDGVQLKDPKVPLHGQLCLMQIGTARGEVFVIDVLVLGAAAFQRPSGFSPPVPSLAELLANTWPTKVVHDFRQDADALWHQFRVSVAGLFDTQLCDVLIRRLDGFKTTFVTGSAKLCSTRNITLEHIPGHGLLTQELKLSIHSRFSEDRHLWERRPLPNDMLLYARADVLSLPQLHTLLSRDLAKRLGGQEQLAEHLIRASSSHYNLSFVEKSYCCCRLCVRTEEFARFDGNRVLKRLAGEVPEWLLQQLLRPEDEVPQPTPGPSRFYVNERDESVPLPGA